jgi:hypothetical protein
VFSENLVVVCSSVLSSLAVLQSRAHLAWVQLTSSTLEDRQGYRPSDCFETFPFPQPDPRTVIPALEDIGQGLYETRAKYMVDTQQGLTQTYNHLKDPDCHEERIDHLRRLHEEMDRAVLQAYADATADQSWTAIEVPPYAPASSAPADQEHHAKSLAQFNEQVIDRLFLLNAHRAHPSAARGLAQADRDE